MDRDLISRLWSMIEPILEPEGLELVELEFRFESNRWVLRLYIDSPGGVGLAECELVSRQVGALLDMEDPIPQRYNLEVSSPGINRVLRKLEHFAKYTGSPVKIRAREKVDDRRNFKGILKGVRNSMIVVEIDGSEYEIAAENVETARLDLPETELFRKDLGNHRVATGD